MLEASLSQLCSSRSWGDGVRWDLLPLSCLAKNISYYRHTAYYWPDNIFNGSIARSHGRWRGFENFLIGPFPRFFLHIWSLGGVVDGKASTILRDTTWVAAHFGCHGTPWDDNVWDTTATTHDTATSKQQGFSEKSQKISSGNSNQKRNQNKAKVQLIVVLKNRKMSLTYLLLKHVIPPVQNQEYKLWLLCSRTKQICKPDETFQKKWEVQNRSRSVFINLPKVSSGGAKNSDSATNWQWRWQILFKICRVAVASRLVEHSSMENWITSSAQTIL